MPELAVIEAEDQAADVIDALERALTKARAGQLSSVAIVYVYRDGTTGHRRSKLPSYPAMMGAVARFMHKLNLDMDEG